MPLRSRISPRLGTIGTTAMRLFSACVEQLLVPQHLQVDQPRAEQAEANSTNGAAAEQSGMRKRDELAARRSSVRSCAASLGVAACSQRPILVRIGRAALRREQQPASTTGHSSASNTGASSSSQPGNMPPAIMRTTSDDGVRGDEQRQDLHRLRRHREPEQPPVDA